MKKLFLIALILKSSLSLAADRPEKDNLKNQRTVLTVLKYGVQIAPWIISGLLLLKTKKQEEQLIEANGTIENLRHTIKFNRAIRPDKPQGICF